MLLNGLLNTPRTYLSSACFTIFMCMKPLALLMFSSEAHHARHSRWRQRVDEWEGRRWEEKVRVSQTCPYQYRAVPDFNQSNNISSFIRMGYFYGNQRNRTAALTSATVNSPFLRFHNFWPSSYLHERCVVSFPHRYELLNHDTIYKNFSKRLNRVMKKIIKNINYALMSRTADALLCKNKYNNS